MDPNQRNEHISRAVHRLAIGLWLVLAVVIAGKTLQNPENHSTYPLFHDASLAWWNGVNVYDRDVFERDYRYGPSFAMVLGPIAWLPYEIGAVFWALMNVGVAFCAIRALAQRILPGMQSPLARNLLLAVSIFPCTHCLYSSQTNLLVFSLVAFAATAILDERWWLAALLLAIPVHIKVWPLAAALLLAACWPRRLAWRLPMALAAVAALPLLAKPPAWVFQQYVQWYRLLVGPAQFRHTYRDAWTIWELISSAVDPRRQPPTWYTVLQLATAAAVLGLCLWQTSRVLPQRRVLFVLACWTSWQLVFGPGTERNTFALIAPLTSWALVVAVLEKRAPWFMGFSFFLTVLAAVGGVEDLFPWLKALHPVGVLLFFAWFLWWNLEQPRMTEPLAISACIICKNAADKIGLALDSLAWCDEIVVVDSGSTDDTVKVCQSHPSGKVRVLFNAWPGFNPQRQFAANQCRNAWVLMLDDDEECSDELRRELQSLAPAAVEQVAIFKMPRQNFVAQRHVRCWGPDYQTRFIHREHVQWDSRSSPEIRTPTPGFTTSRLSGPLLHNRLRPYQPSDFNEGARRAMKVADLVRHMQRKGKRAGFVNLLLDPLFTFFKYYVLRGGFLDGRFGLVIAYKTTIGAMLKYSVLYGKELDREPNGTRSR